MSDLTIAKTYIDAGIFLPAGRGGEVMMRCPKCSDDRTKHRNSKPLSVNVDKGVWNCNHCGWRGKIDENSAPARPIVAKVYKRPEYVAQTSSGDKLAEWFSRRGINAETVEAFKVRAASEWMPQTEKEERVIQFPYFRDGKCINIKSRTNDKLFRLAKDAERILFNLDSIGETVVIVEGEIDAMSVHQAGYTSVVSVPDGAPKPDAVNLESKFTFLDDPRLEFVKNWIIAVDNDEPGARLQQELLRRFGDEKCLTVEWPKGCKDANEVLTTYSVEVLRGCLDAARPVPLEGIYTADDFSDEIDRLYTHGARRGLMTGWGDVNAFYTVQEGELTVVTGAPTSGKSEWLDSLSVNLSVDHGWRFGVFSPENSPRSTHIVKLMEKFIGKWFDETPKFEEYERMDRDELAVCKRWAAQNYFMINPDDCSLASILSHAQKLVRRHGIRGLIIDPWNTLEHGRPSHMSETEYVSQCLSMLTGFARKERVHVWLVAHPRKLQTLSSGAYAVATAYDISGSAHFFNKADNIVSVWRDAKAAPRYVEIHVQKIKQQFTGKQGVCRLFYDIGSKNYQDGSGEMMTPAYRLTMRLNRDELVEW